MRADNFTPLVPPQQAQITINPTAKECPSTGFNYPTFRLLNKQERTKLSSTRHVHDPSLNYALFASSNSRGWFTAVTVQDDGSYALICSPLADLRAACKSAKASDGTFTPKRSISLFSRKPNIIAIVCNDTRLFVSFERGELVAYDTATIFSAGSDAVQPLHTLAADGGPVRQILGNPGTEQSVIDHVVVLYSNKTVVLYNSQLEVQGGWISTHHDPDCAPTAVAWSPKGKHIAIGLRTGDILTYPLTNKGTIHKHIPPTNTAPLISLHWLLPGHTFHTAYGTTVPIQHILSIDTKTPTGVYYALGCPFPLPDRSNQSYFAFLPRWDEDVGDTEPKSLVVVGDRASVDLEVLGSIGTRWYQESQENPVALPLDSDMDDTLLLAVDVDLTDSGASAAPMIYLYLNDGTVQVWYMEHSKPYVGLNTPDSTKALLPAHTTLSAPSQPIPTSSTPTTSSALVPTQSVFGQSASSTFSQSTFEQLSNFDQTTTQVANTFGTTGFGQKLPAATLAFGQLASMDSPPVFGQTTFGGTSPTSAFGQNRLTTSAFDQASTPVSAFGQRVGQSVFGLSSGAIGGETLGVGPTSAFLGGSPGGPHESNQTTSAIGGSAFGSSYANAFSGSAFGATGTDNTTNNTFGQPSFGFGSTTSAAAMTREESMSDTPPTLGGMGLGEVNDPSLPAKSGGIFGTFSPVADSPNLPPNLSFGGPIKPASGAFSNYTNSVPVTTASDERKLDSGFGKSGFAASAFGQSAFGKSVTHASTSNVIGGGFDAFASTPTSFANAAAQQKVNPDTPRKSTTSGFASFASSVPSAFGSPTRSTITSPSPFSGTTSQAIVTTTSPFSASSPQPKFPFAPAGNTGPAFGNPSLSVSPFGPQPGVRSKSPFERDTSLQQTTSKPVMLSSPSSSPDSTPRLLRATIVNDNDSPPTPSPFNSLTTPASSPLGNVVAPSLGAFANIQTTPSAFKPATGFGAFGSDKTPSLSPFYKAVSTEPKTPPISAFPVALSTPLSAMTSPPSQTLSPAFGTASTLGSARSAFAPVTSSPTPSKLPVTGGFGAFSGSAVGFGALARPKKSFGELLKLGDNDTTDPVKPNTGNVEELSTTEDKSKAISTFPTTVKDDSLGSVLPPFPKVEATERKKEAESPVSSQVGVGNRGTEKQELREEGSFGNLSLLSDASSFAEVEREESDDGNIQSGSEDADGENADYDDEGSFLSDEADDTGEVEEGEIESEESSQLSDVPEVDEDEHESLPPAIALEPATVALPGSRSSSSTPQPEIPEVNIALSPPPEPVLARSREESTTPPSTPAKETAPALRSTSLPAPSTTLSTPFGLGLGRPSTRPTRSSPLATTAISLADGNGGPLAKPPSPKSRVAILAPTEAPLKDEASSSKPPPRPKTPPLLSAFGSRQSDAYSANPLTFPPISNMPAIPPTQAPSTTLVPPLASNLPSSSPSTEVPILTGTVGSLKPMANMILPKPVSPPGPAPPTAGFGLFGTPPVPVATPGSSPVDLGGFSLKGKDAEANAMPVFPLPTTGAPTSTGPGFFESGFTLSEASGKGKEDVQSPLPTSMFPATATGAAPSPPPPAAPVVSAPFNFSGINLKPAGPTTSFFGAPPPFNLSSIGTKGNDGVATTTATAPISQAVTHISTILAEAGLQRECQVIYTITSEDLSNLGKLAEHHTRQLAIIRAQAVGGRQKIDLGDSKRWSLPGAIQFGQVLVQYEKDLDQLRDLQEAQRTMLREIRSNMLKAGTRKEEISRFNQAKSDKEFAKMLKARSLGPETLETQTQLRRNIRTMRDRIQKLEDHLQGLKKRLTQVKTGRPAFRPPSLDTINRTYRNIDLAIQQQSSEVVALKKRITKLRFITPETSHNFSPSRSFPKSTSTSPSTPHRDAHYAPATPTPNTLPPSNVTPHVAATTAAALNAERAAARLKRSLLLTRKEPLLNTKVAHAPAAPLSFNTPQKVAPPVWSPPERRGATGAKKHNVIPLKKSGAGSSSSVGAGTSSAPAFNWGPLPKFDYNSKESFAMVEAVKLTPPKRAGP